MPHVEIPKIHKNGKFENLFWGWVLTRMSSYGIKWWIGCIWICFTSSISSLGNLIHFKISTKIKSFWNQKFVGCNFQFFKGVPKSNYIVVRVFPGVRKGHIFFPVISCTILLRFYLYPQVFLKKSLFRIFHYMTIFRRSSSGWVLMVLKVIPSKSSKSGEHFKYLQRTHIFHSSWDFLHFLPKTPPVVCYILMHHYIWGAFIRSKSKILYFF